MPGIFVYREDHTKRHLIIDGNQRLKTLQFFFDGTFKNQGFSLIDVDNRWLHKTFENLDESDRRTLEDAIIHTTVFRQNRPNKDIKSVYEVFERLNTGGIKLQAQEIRHCVSYGSFVKLLEELNRNAEWRAIYGRENIRLKDCELILRFLALMYEGAYKKPMRDFLDNFISVNRNLDEAHRKRFTSAFVETIATICNSIGEKAFRPEKLINAAVFDSVMVGLARRAQKGPINDLAQISKRYSELLENGEFWLAYTRATSDEENVRKRFEACQGSFRKCIIMMLELHKETQRVDNIFSLTSKVADDIECQAHWARYLTIVTAGYLEVSVKRILGVYAERSAAPAVAAYANHHLASFRTANSERICQLLRSSRNDWDETLRKSWDDEAKDAVDSVVNIRHR